MWRSGPSYRWRSLKPTCRAIASRCGADQACTSCIIRCAMARSSTLSRSSAPRRHAEKGDVAAYRAELEHTYRNAHPVDACLIGMLDLALAPGRRRPRSGAALAQRPRRAARRRRARAAAIAGAGRRHGDRGRFVSRRIDRRADDDFAAAFRRFEAARLLRTARVQLESRVLWDFYDLDEGIARDVRNATVADWDEAHLFDCLSWLYDGAAFQS